MYTNFRTLVELKNKTKTELEWHEQNNDVVRIYGVQGSAYWERWDQIISYSLFTKIDTFIIKISRFSIWMKLICKEDKLYRRMGPTVNVLHCCANITEKAISRQIMRAM